MGGEEGKGTGEIQSGVCSATISIIPTIAGTLHEEW